jgi:hypothetical protein
VKLKARATGELTSKSLNLDATLQKATFINPSTGSGTDSGSESENADPSAGPSASSGTDSGTVNNGGIGIIPTPTDPEDDQPGGGD